MDKVYMLYELSTYFHGVPLPRVGRATFASYITISLHVCGMFNTVTLMLTKSFCYIRIVL